MEKYNVASATGETVSKQANDGDGVTTKTITGATTLTRSDSGKVIVMSAAAGAAITLPAVADGLNYKFVNGLTFATTAWVITATTSVIQGTVVVDGASVLGADENTITFAHAADTVGDWVEIFSDGTNWYISGVASAAAGITLTDV